MDSDAAEGRTAEGGSHGRGARGDHNFGRASERFVSERLRRGKR